MKFRVSLTKIINAATHSGHSRFTDVAHFMGKIIFINLISIMLLSCAPSIVENDLNNIPPGQVLVFGQIKATNFEILPKYEIYLKSPGLREEIKKSIKDYGYFYWHLKPGQYTITSFKLGGGFGRIWVHFEVSRESRVTYIGTLLLTLGPVSDVTVENNIVRAAERLKQKFTRTDVKVSTSLMEKEKT